MLNRFAAQVWDAYKNNGQIQDIAETLLGAGISAGGQLIFTDMDAAEIAASTAIGSGLAIAARPVGARVGYALGKGLDRAVPNALSDVEQFIPITRSGMAAALKPMRKEGVPREFAKATHEMLTAKRNQNAFLPDGTARGTAETILGYYGRNRADNVAQFGFAALSPLLYGNSGSSTDETGQGYVGV